MKRLLRVPAQTAQALIRYFQIESAAGILLMAAAALAMVVANSPWAGDYVEFLALRMPVSIGPLLLDKTSTMWINDGLMALFFLLVGLELKREMRQGQLSQPGSLVLPLACALGGIAVPMLIYAALNWGDAAAMRGIAIPAATDIAFALGVLMLLGSRVPIELKLLLTAIAVLDDVAAILIIAVFYTSELVWPALAVAAAALLALGMMNREGVVRLLPYLLVGAVLWLAVLKSGVHATLAGVALGFAVPLRDARDASSSPLETLEARLHPWVAFGILPLFAFANSGIALGGLDWRQLTEAVPLGIVLGLVLGKPVGVMLAVKIAGKLGLAKMPAGVNISQLFGMAMLCGIGFTMSLFIKNMAFDDASQLAGNSQLAILIASTLSAMAGYAWLRTALPRAR